jgi:thiol-disulfide isomerase/thioredoxin
MYDVLFANNDALDPGSLADYAAGVGLDAGKFATCVADPAVQERVVAASKVGLALKVGGTPTFFVNGRRFVGSLDPAALRAVLDAVKALPAAGPGGPEVVGAVPPRDPVTFEGLRGPFAIDAFEASFADGVLRSVPGVEPARGVTWSEADAACRSAGKRLCTEDEWLVACTGGIPKDADGDGLLSEETLARAHPYGADFDPTKCASARTRNDPAPLRTGDHPGCATPEGVYDLEGGVKEWVGLTPDRAGLKGGSYFSGDSARCAYFKDGEAPDAADRANGFRCCAGPEPERTDAFPGGKVGDPVADWSLPLLDGGTVSTASLKGHPFVMTFWASYCGPCRQEMPELSKLYEKYRDQGLIVVGIDVDTSADKARAFLRGVPVSFPIALDPASEVMAKFATRGTPTTFWVTKSGKIRQRTVGYVENGAAAMEANARALIAAD